MWTTRGMLAAVFLWVAFGSAASAVVERTSQLDLRALALPTSDLSTRVSVSPFSVDAGDTFIFHLGFGEDRLGFKDSISGAFDIIALNFLSNPAGQSGFLFTGTWHFEGVEGELLANDLTFSYGGPIGGDTTNTNLTDSAFSIAGVTYTVNVLSKEAGRPAFSADAVEFRAFAGGRPPDAITVQGVPEPAAASLVAFGLLVLGMLRRARSDAPAHQVERVDAALGTCWRRERGFMRLIRTASNWALWLLLLIVPCAAKAFVLFGDGYVPSASDTYVKADATVCCVGQYVGLNSYLEQTFVATGRTPSSLTLGLVNLQPADVPPAPFRFRLLFTEVEPSSRPGAVLWESEDLSIPVDSLGFREVTTNLSGLHLTPGATYAWILDTYSTRDDFSDAGEWFGNIGHDAPAYLDGVLYVKPASVLGRAADFAGPWTNSGFDAAFLIRYSGELPEPSTAALALLAVSLAVVFMRRAASRGCPPD